MYTELNYDESLYHHGIKGQRWGQRRYQNEDGSLTAVVGKGVGSYINKTGTELSLQQRSIRKKYVQGKTPASRKID